MRWRIHATIAVFGVAGFGVAGCGGAPSGPAPPAPEKPRVESELALVAIAGTAHASLGIEEKRIEPRLTQEHVALTGWIMAPQGHEVTVTAPHAGYVRGAAGRPRFPTAGEAVAAGAPLFALEPVLTPLEAIQLATLKRGVESELAKAKITIKAAGAELQRVQELQAQGLRGQQEVELAKKALDHAAEDLKTAQDKQGLFALAAAPIAAPRAGEVLSVQASPGQYVPAAAPLITVIDLKQAWIRVAVPEFDLPLVDRSKPVAVSWRSHGTLPAPGRNDAPPAAQARFLTQAPQVDAGRHTGDLIYELVPGGKAPPLVKNQAVTVHVPLGKERRETLVPYSAVVFDGFGGSWIYLDRTGADAGAGHQYLRRRVELGWSAGQEVAVHPGFSGPERVVVAGAAVLFSREFHRPPVQGPAPPVDDDD